jgi:hypothetical protein
VLLATDLASKIDYKTKGISSIKRKELTGATYETYVNGKTGIIYFEDYWKRAGETDETKSGDHIDLWNKNELASNGLIKSWVRRTFPEFSEDWLSMSDLKKSKKVIFWEIK